MMFEGDARYIVISEDSTQPGWESAISIMLWLKQTPGTIAICWRCLHDRTSRIMNTREQPGKIRLTVLCSTWKTTTGTFYIS